MNRKQRRLEKSRNRSHKRPATLRPEQLRKVQETMDKAAAHHEAGDLANATTAYEMALALMPNLAEAHYNLALILSDQGRDNEAATRYNQAIASRPDFVEAYNNLGNILKEQGKLEEAAA